MSIGDRMTLEYTELLTTERDLDGEAATAALIADLMREAAEGGGEEADDEAPPARQSGPGRRGGASG